MKKFLQFATMLTVGCFFLVGCGKSTPDSPPIIDPISLTVSTNSPSVFEGSDVVITIKATRIVTKALVVQLISDNSALTVPETLTIEEGKNVVTGIAQTKSVGIAKITIAAQGVVYGAESTTVNIKEKETPKPTDLVLATLEATGILNPPKDIYMSFVSESEKYGKVYPGCLYAHDYDKVGGTPTGIKKSTIDYYGGSVVGKIAGDEVFITSIPEGTVIDGNLAWQDYYTTYMRFPILVKDGDVTNSLSNGTHFIVLALSDQGDPTKLPNGYDDAVYVPSWMKIKVTGMQIEVLDGAMLLDGKGEFKVGQK